MRKRAAIQGQPNRKKSACQPHAADVGLVHGCTPTAARAIEFGRTHIRPVLKVTRLTIISRTVEQLA